MMNTPICDYTQQYAQSNPLRLHMPGHKGMIRLGCEHLDITEIDGADSLFEANGIIAQSENNASQLFGCPTFYSTEGSSLCIRAMLYLTVLYAKEQGQHPLIAAARNVHSSFIKAASMLDFDIHWLYSKEDHSYLSCIIAPQALDNWLQSATSKPTAVYLTSPDYLGNIQDIQAISRICHKHHVLLLVDNAHGAYLRFLDHSMHPMDLGADLCCDSAHKTLSVLTGGAYLHISKQAPSIFMRQAKQALSMFASTSPSYLILQSLDLANQRLDQEYPAQLAALVKNITKAKASLSSNGYRFIGNEPIKLTVDCKPYGYTGTELARILQKQNIYPEFYDRDHLVLMLTPDIDFDGLAKLEAVLSQIPQREPLSDAAPRLHPGNQVMTPRQAAFSLCQTIPIHESLGRVLAAPTVGCPPAVPIVVSGEQITQAAIDCFSYYGITTCCVTIP